MESPVVETQGAKRKRTPVDDPVGRAAPGHMVGGVNYLMKSKPEKLKLIEGGSESFADILGMIDDYEGVLQRHESLAASLGAKLVGPLLLKTLDKLFDGPIKVVQTSFALEQSPATWLDIVTFARSSLPDFVLADVPYGKACRIWIKGGQIEISEDDYRLILSGAPERMIPTQPMIEDETAELGTLNILETRLALIIKKADAVASKARQLNYHLKGRKTAIIARKAEQSSGNLEMTAGEPRPFSPSSFSPVNIRSPKPVGGDAKVQQELLEQFMAPDRNDRRASLAHTPRAKGRAVASDPTLNGDGDGRRMSHPVTSSDDGIEGQYRLLMATKIEKLARGDVIAPPCDRCRRLQFECTKHLTACSACTKKHAKCSWKDLKEGELEGVPVVSGAGQEGSGDNGYKSEDPKHGSGPSREPTVEQADSVMVGYEASHTHNLDEHSMLTQIASAAQAAATAAT